SASCSSPSSRPALPRSARGRRSSPPAASGARRRRGRSSAASTRWRAGSAPRARSSSPARPAAATELPSWRPGAAGSTGSGPGSRGAEVRAPEFADVLGARRTIEPHLRPTPLRAYYGLSELLGAEVLVKHENHLPTGAFKVRGGVNLVAHLTPDERERGLVTASTGNHGQSIALAARLFGVRAIVCVPERPNPAKIGAIRSLGGEIV